MPMQYLIEPIIFTLVFIAVHIVSMVLILKAKRRKRTPIFNMMVSASY